MRKTEKKEEMKDERKAKKEKSNVLHKSEGRGGKAGRR